MFITSQQKLSVFFFVSHGDHSVQGGVFPESASALYAVIDGQPGDLRFLPVCPVTEILVPVIQKRHGILPLICLVVRPAASKKGNDESFSVALYGAHITVSRVGGKPCFSGQNPVRHIQKRVCIMYGKFSFTAEIAEGVFPGFCDLKKGGAPDGVPHDQRQVVSGGVMHSPAILIIQSVGRHKMTVRTPDFRRLLIHHPGEALHGTSDMLRYGHRCIVMALQHQGIEKVFQIILFSLLHIQLHVRLSRRPRRDFDVIVSLSVFQGKYTGENLCGTGVGPGIISVFFIQNSPGPGIHKHCGKGVQIFRIRLYRDCGEKKDRYKDNCSCGMSDFHNPPLHILIEYFMQTCPVCIPYLSFYTFSYIRDVKAPPVNRYRYGTSVPKAAGLLLREYKVLPDISEL